MLWHMSNAWHRRPAQHSARSGMQAVLLEGRKGPGWVPVQLWACLIS